jgi:orotate phosphoribosyltransferase
MINQEIEIAKLLLQSKAILLNPSNPFTWASGWKSPIYCDNRKTLSFPDIRTTIKEAFASLIKEKFPEVEKIAGVATGAIAQGALTADLLNLPFIYIRSAPKGHGLENLIEGELHQNEKVVVIEDLVSTGGSSLKAVEALKNAGANVLGMTAIFTYGFPTAEESFKAKNCKLFTLTNYQSLLELALSNNYITLEQVSLLKKWREAPAEWQGK